MTPKCYYKGCPNQAVVIVKVGGKLSPIFMHHLHQLKERRDKRLKKK